MSTYNGTPLTPAEAQRQQWSPVWVLIAAACAADLLRPVCPDIRHTYGTHHEDERRRRIGRRLLALTIATGASGLYWHLLNPRGSRR